MKKDVKSPFYIAEVTPPRGLLSLILERIELARRRSARVRLGFFSALALIFALALVPATSYMLHDLYTSGFYDYASLVFSNGSLVLTYWKEFGFLMIESLPSLALLLMLPLVAALVWSLKRLVGSVRAAFPLSLNA